ncbi:hypothetical protein, partial [Nocardia cyriacigeorgica]|uniref:hypothetical protein n=1 Tax=Nocardia cyriacigeorgica TaxID=135487 RepID=UPI001E2D270A
MTLPAEDHLLSPNEADAHQCDVFDQQDPQANGRFRARGAHLRRPASRSHEGSASGWFSRAITRIIGGESPPSQPASVLRIYLMKIPLIPRRALPGAAAACLAGVTIAL